MMIEHHCYTTIHLLRHSIKKKLSILPTSIDFRDIVENDHIQKSYSTSMLTVKYLITDMSSIKDNKKQSFYIIS